MNLPTQIMSWWSEQLVAEPRRDNTTNLLVWAQMSRRPRRQRMSFEPCTNAISFARTCKQSLSLSVNVQVRGRINHIFRVHDHTILTEETAAKTFGQVGQVSLDWRSKPRSVQGSQELGVRDR